MSMYLDQIDVEMQLYETWRMFGSHCLVPFTCFPRKFNFIHMARAEAFQEPCMNIFDTLTSHAILCLSQLAVSIYEC